MQEPLESQSTLPNMVTYLSFELDDAFVDEYRIRETYTSPFKSTVGLATFYRTYSRSDNPRKKEGVMETWTDVCRRVIEGMHTIEKDHCLEQGINWNEEKAQQAAREAFALLYEFKWTPPGRGLQFMGTRMVHEDKDVEALWNCAFVTTSNIDKTYGESFRWLMNMSMMGVGVGFDVLGAGKVTITSPAEDNVFYHIIQDTREAWAESVKDLVESYMGLLPRIIFNYSLIRPAGAPIKRFGGTASGPEALIACHRDIGMVLDRNVGRGITSTTITDIMNIIGVAVVAGNTRRSAEIAVGYPEDIAFINLKTPEKMKLRPWGYLSNNSVFAHKGTDYENLARLTYENGEPGYLWLDNAHSYARMNKVIDKTDIDTVGVNPCAEIALEHKEMCNLADINMPYVGPKERRQVVKHAYRYCKIVTLASKDITDRTSRAVMLRNRRIGLSPSGSAQYYDMYGGHQLVGTLSEMYDYVQRYDKLYSQWYEVSRSIRTTSVKPSGTVSLLANVTPGAHFSVAGSIFLRRVTMKAGSTLAVMLAAAGYPVEPSVYSDDTWVVSFPGVFPDGVRSEADVDIWEQLKLAQILSRYWADNLTSVTLKFDRDKVKVEELTQVIKAAESTLKSVSFLPLEKGIYEQMPYEVLTKEEYDKLRAKITPFKLSGEVRGLHDNTDAWCEKDGCVVPEYKYAEMDARPGGA